VVGKVQAPMAIASTVNTKINRENLIIGFLKV